MKLIYIVNARIPTEKAHGYQICKMCEEFSQAGARVELWIPTRKNPIKEDVFEFYHLKKNFIIKKIPIFNWLRWDRLIGRLSYFFLRIFFLIKLLFIKLPNEAVIFSRQPEIIWLFKFRKRIVVYEAHGWFNKKLPLYLLKKCDYIITTNYFIRNKFIENQFDSKKIAVAPNGIDLQIFNINATKEEAYKKVNLREKIKENLLSKIVLVYTGSFKTSGNSKGIDEILQALKILNDKNLFFLAVGGSLGDINYYQQLVENLKIKDRIFFLTRVDQKTLALIQKVADVLLMPFPLKAHYQYLNMTPLKMFEYMASKRPIIASNLPSFKEILNERNCFFCLPSNVDSLVAAIKLVIESPDQAKTKSLQAFRDVAKYTWQKRVYKILNFIHENNN